MTSPRSPSAPLPDFLPFGFSKQSLLYHAPIRIKVFDFHRTRENEQRVGLRKSQSLFSARFHESPLSATADPENDRFQAVSKGKRQLSWFWGASISMAHGVVSKDGTLGSKRGGTSLQSTGMVLPANIRVPRSSPLLKRTFSPPGRKHDLS
jgi:hypothetical protein